MRKTILILTLIASLSLGLILTANAQKPVGMQDMWANVYRWDGSMSDDGLMQVSRITSGITFVVLQRNSTVTMETLYQYGRKTLITTGMAQPVTGTSFAATAVCDDKVAFAVDPGEAGDTYVDLIVVDQAGGYTAIVNDFNQYKHTIVIDERPLKKHWGAAWLITTATSTEVDSGIELARPSIIHDLKIQVCTAFASTAVVHVGLAAAGTNGDIDGFIHGEQVATQGWNSIYRPGVDLTSYLVSSGGVRGCYASTRTPADGLLGPSLGTFMGNWMVGTAHTADLSDVGIGLLNKEELVVHGTTEQTLAYMFGTGVASAVAANSTGWGIVWFNFTAIR